jgi:predicted nucleic-acid-binding protein
VSGQGFQTHKPFFYSVLQLLCGSWFNCWYKALLDSPALLKFEAVSEAVSFTDCLVMAVADEYGTKDIFGFDKHFEDAGYQRLEPSTEWKQGA